MLLPSKLCSYKESILSKFPIVLKVVRKGPISILALYHEVVNEMTGVTEFMDVLDCLFALHKIEYDDEKEVLQYVA